MTRKRDGDKAVWLLSELPADAKHALGFKELLARTKLGSKSKRIGSPSTLQNHLRRLVQDGYIEKKPGQQIGRGHKAGYYRTPKGTNRLTGKLVKTFPQCGELDLLRSFNTFPDVDGHVFVYSQAPITDFDENNLAALSFSAPEFILRLEDALAKKHPVLRENASFGDRQSRFELLERRYETSGKTGSNLRTSYHQEAMIMEARKQGLAPDELTYDMVGKRLDHIPLSKAEYKEYFQLQKDSRKISEAWKIAEQPLAVLICNPEFTYQLVLGGKLIVNDGGWYENVDDFVTKLDDKKLLKAETEFWEARNTAKYARRVIFDFQDENGELVSGRRIDGPQNFGLHYPSHILKTVPARHMYFKKIHEALTRELAKRELKELPHDHEASAKDLITTESKKLGREPTETETRPTCINVVYRSKE